MMCGIMWCVFWSLSIVTFPGHLRLLSTRERIRNLAGSALHREHSLPGDHYPCSGTSPRGHPNLTAPIPQKQGSVLCIYSYLKVSAMRTREAFSTGPKLASVAMTMIKINITTTCIGLKVNGTA